MSDENVVFNRDPLTYECVTGDFAIFPDRRVFLYFNERSDLRVVPDFAPVQIDEFGKLHATSQLHARRNRAVFAHSGTNRVLSL
jgi:hypothetical protein